MRVVRVRQPATLGMTLVTAIMLMAAACSSGSDFPDPSNPVSGTPWPDYELLRYDITDQRDVKLGTVDMEIRLVGDLYEMRLLFLLPETEVRDEIFVTVDAETLAPLSYSRLAEDPDNRIEAAGTYREGEDGPLLESLVTDNGEEESERIELSEFAFDTDSSAWLWRSIAFEEGIELTYSSVNVLRQRAQLVRLEVVGQDVVRAPAGAFLSWQIEVRPGLDRQNAWYEVAPPHRLIRWDLEPRRYTLREVVTDPDAGGS